MEDRPPQRRTRYQLTHGSLAYFVVASLSLGVGVYTQANPLFWAFGLMVGGMVVSFIVLWVMMRRIDAERIPPAHGVAGESMILRYRVVNHKAWIPVFGLVVREGWGDGSNGHLRKGPIAETPPRLKGQPHGWVLHLAPNTTLQAEAPCWPIRRGVLKFEKIQLSSTFPFGILRRTLEIEAPGECLVYPHLYRINRRILHQMAEMDPQGKKRLERAGGTEEFFGLRAYRAGDSLKMIDWKRTAKTGELITREMTQPSPPRIMVALDLRNLQNLGPKDEDKGKKDKRKTGQHVVVDEKTAAIERSLSLTASIICDAYFNGYQVGLVVHGADVRPFSVHHSLPHRTRMLEALSRLDPDIKSDQMPNMPSRPNVVIRPGQAGGRGDGATQLGTENMNEYVIDAEGGASTLLSSRHSRRVARRAVIAGDDPWA